MRCFLHRVDVGVRNEKEGEEPTVWRSSAPLVISWTMDLF